MEKEKIKQLMDVMQAYVNGKTIQYYKVDLSFKIKHPGEPNFNDKWVDVDEEHLFRPDMYDYRIKPKPKYRPFKDAVECWLEMLKHQPFGWVKTIANIPELHNISAIFPSAEFPVLLGIDLEEGDAREYSLKLSKMYDLYTFADGAPFGVKEGV